MTATMDLEVEEEKKVETLTLDGAAVRFEVRVGESLPGNECTGIDADGLAEHAFLGAPDLDLRVARE